MVSWSLGQGLEKKLYPVKPNPSVAISPDNWTHGALSFSLGPAPLYMPPLIILFPTSYQLTQILAPWVIFLSVAPHRTLLTTNLVLTSASPVHISW